MTDDKYCGQCKHWHKRPFLKQDTIIPIGDCDKIEKGRPYPSCNKDEPFYYDGWSFKDEVYDDVFHCWEEAESEGKE